jgi:hypothetical protein
MPKQSITRWILGIAVVSFAALGIAFGWQGSPRVHGAGTGGIDRSGVDQSGIDRGDFARRHSELRFLKAAFDRLEAEAKQNPDSPALGSLHAEQQAIVRRMREVAHPLPADELPRELRVLAKPDPDLVVVGPASSDRSQNAAGSATAVIGPKVTSLKVKSLRTGLGSARAASDLSLPHDPGLNLIVLVVRPRPARTKETSAGTSIDEQPSKFDAKPGTKTRPVEKAAAQPPLSGTAGLIERARAEPATAGR